MDSQHRHLQQTGLASLTVSPTAASDARTLRRQGHFLERSTRPWRCQCANPWSRNLRTKISSVIDMGTHPPWSPFFRLAGASLTDAIQFAFVIAVWSLLPLPRQDGEPDKSRAPDFYEKIHHYTPGFYVEHFPSWSWTGILNSTWHLERDLGC